MVNVIGVRFKPAGKTYYFDPLDFDIKQGDSVIVETSRGIEYGEVVMSKKAIDNDQFKKPLKGVIRIATEEDTEKSKRNRELEKEAYRICLEKIQNHKLEMKLVEVEYTFDGNKILFYFTADGRIDFRELVKDLAMVFKTRIELRQIGVSIYFGSPDKKQFQKIVSTLADRYGVRMSEDELLLKANQWELSHGGLSGRTAQQFIDYLLGQ